MSDKQLVDPYQDQRGLAMAGVNAGAVSIEIERAVAEARGQMQLAKMFPRDLNAARAELRQSCQILAMAEVAFYSVPNRGTGPSIRLAEEIARVCGNIEYGHRELSRSDGKSEVEVYCWDKQTNTRSIRQLTVKHVVDTKNGPKPCRDESDIDNLIANKASKQVRGRILALAPKWLVQEAIQWCRDTLNRGEDGETMQMRVNKMSDAFAKFGVTTKHLSDYLGHGLDTITSDELVDIRAIYNAIKEGDITPSEAFKRDDQQHHEVADPDAGKQQLQAPASEPEKKPEPAARAPRKPREPKPQPTPETPAVDPTPETQQAPKAEAAPAPTQEAAPETPEATDDDLAGLFGGDEPPAEEPQPEGGEPSDPLLEPSQPGDMF